MRTPDNDEAGDLALLEAELRELRPRPSEDFAAELDARAAAGFPTPPTRVGAAGPLARLRSRAARRPLIPAAAGGLAAVLIAVAIGVSQIGEDGQTGDGATTLLAPEGSPGGEGALPGSGRGGAVPLSGERSALEDAPAARGNEFATGAGRRLVERDASLTLAAEPGEIDSAAGEVFEVVRRHQGIVLSSSVREGRDAEASFDLLIPSGRLGEALGDLSAIAKVRSRSEGSLDITKPFVTVRERLRDARAEAEALLEELAEADTETEIESIRARLSGVRAEIAGLRAAKERLERRADFARVSLQIAAEGGSASGAWTIGDALDDAGRVLTVAVGVVVVSLAVLLPIGLLGGLGWAARRTVIRRGREAALG